MGISTTVLSKYLHHPLKAVHKNCTGIANLKSFNQHRGGQVYAAVSREVNVVGHV